ncbi:hypothetical protein STBA_37900 [Streptomyces sp. MP131-18]|nr:hypothetical protein STBA_37900 [Streptomyces sp. MP131-18]
MCRVSCTRITRTPARSQRRTDSRLKFLGSIGVPYRVVKTMSEPDETSLAVSRAAARSFCRARRAAVQISGRGSTASDASVLATSEWIS